MSAGASKMTNRLPEIFIIGTMKGGTTILFDYILTHPMVVAGSSKEIHYFSLYSYRGAAWYLDHFTERPNDILSIDASPTYFDVAYTSGIPGFIKAAVPEAKLLLLVRDPIERAISHFHHLKFVTHQPLFASTEINDFFSRPIEGCYSKQTSYDVHLDQILSFSLYQQKYQSYTHVFGPNKVLVLLNSELRNKPVETMQRVFSHCGLEWAFSDFFGVQRYVTGSEKVQLDPAVHSRLAELLYPNYQAFCQAAGLPFLERSVDR